MFQTKTDFFINHFNPVSFKNVYLMHTNVDYFVFFLGFKNEIHNEIVINLNFNLELYFQL